jgi:RNA polymerase sigma factor (sigma-70 family)
MDSWRLQKVVRYIRRIAQPNQVTKNDRQLLQAFANSGDQAAFTRIVERHAGMVLGVCKRILRNHHEAEDATQAVFFVLARKAGTLNWRESIAPWLSSVAYRVSVKARSLATYPLDSCPELSQPTTNAEQEFCVSELRDIVDEEIERLPKNLRYPIVLCYLEGRTYDQAARDLGWRTSTLKGRLERARAVLRARLSTRDILPGISLSPSFFESCLSPISVSGRLTAGIARVAVLVRAGETSIPGLISPSIAVLMSCPVPGMTLSKAAVLITFVLAIGVSTVAGAIFAHSQRVREVEAPQANAPSNLPATQPIQSTTKASQNPLATPARLDSFGDLLPENAVARFGSTRLRHGSTIRFLRFSPDGKTLVSQAGDGIRIWDAGTATQRRFFPISSPATARGSVDISADGKLMAVTEAVGIAILDVESGRRIATLGDIACARVTISPDGSLIAVIDAASGATVRLCDAKKGEVIRSWDDGEGPITSIAFTNDGRTLVTANTAWRPPSGRPANWITLWDVSSGTPRLRIDTGGFGPVQVVLATNDRRLAALTRTNRQSRILVWDMETGKELWRLEPGPPPPNQPGRPTELNSLTFLPDGKLLVAGQGEDLLVTWSPGSGVEKRKFDRALALSSVLAFSPDGKTLAANPAFSSSIRLIDWETGKDRFPNLANTASELAGVTRKGTVVMRGGHHVLTWEPASNRARQLIEKPEQTFWQARLTADERHLQIWEIHPRRDADFAVSTWELATGREVERIQSAWKVNELIYPLALTPDGKTAAFLDMESRNAVILKDVETGKNLRTLPGNPSALRAKFISNGQILVIWSSGESPALHIWDALSGRSLGSIPYEGPGDGPPGDPCEPAISSDGQMAVVESNNNCLSIYDLHTRGLVQKTKSLVDSPQALAISPDGRCVAWGGKQSPIVAVVEVATGRERARYVGHTGKIRSLAFSGDGKMLVSNSDDTTVLAWDLTGRLGGGQSWGKPWSAEELDAIWNDLASEDSTRAWRAIQRLAAVPNQAVVFFSPRLVPSREAEKEKNRGTNKSNLENLRIRRAVEVIEIIATPDGHRFLQSLADGPAGTDLTTEARAALARSNAAH